MVKRILTGAGIVVGAVAILLLAGTPVFPLVWSFFGSVGMTEYLRAFSLLGKMMYTIPSLLVTAGLPIGCYYLSTDKSMYFLLSVIMGYLLWLAVASVVWHKQTTVTQTAVVSFGTLYVALGFAAFPLLYHAGGNILLVLLVFIGAWVTDTFAYFSGVLLGRHHFAPELSPKKTLEGSIGGIVGCVLAFLVCGLCVAGFTDLSPRYLLLAVCAVPISIVSQVGDLFMSKVKREHSIKDFGRIFPGHGGVLDRFDSVLAIAPLVLMIALVCGATSFHMFA